MPHLGQVPIAGAVGTGVGTVVVSTVVVTVVVATVVVITVGAA